MKIALFTSFSPDLGGGSVQLKSLLPELRDLEVEWYYLAPGEAQSHKGCRLGSAVSSRTLINDLIARTLSLPGRRKGIRALVDKMDADHYWVVAHNEGVLVAAELLASGKTVHLTVHDDPRATFQMSRKYRAFHPLVSRVFSRVIKASTSVDVICEAMRVRYIEEYGVIAFPVLRYLPSLPDTKFAVEKGILRIGHIGTLYRPEPFRAFLNACVSYANKVNKRLIIVRIGGSKHLETIAAENPGVFENAGQLSEGAAIQVLAKCDFVYAMYPAGQRYRLFRQTSFPMKFSTYVQAQRPIFAHTPQDSSLASAIRDHRIGKVCSTNVRGEIEQSIQNTLDLPINSSHFEAVRNDLFGNSQIDRMRVALTRQARVQAVADPQLIS